MNPKFTNQLLNEKSPYLLQHAHNPVNWYPWSETAFNLAKEKDLPIFLSIGYSTCHWCHVMETESFEDIEVAEAMNENFISIKVDREERPDIDNIYMSVCQMITGHGGWPMTIIMTPDKKPFFAGTYFPKVSIGRRLGMLDLIDRVAKVWQTQRNELLSSAEEIVKQLNTIDEVVTNNLLSEEVLDKAFSNFVKRYDQEFGGFGEKPKFPSPHNLMFLMRYYKENKNKKSLDMVENTLTKMRLGGIYDHIGFGFHRYSTDKEWLLPHFEKMLYDQAMLIFAYTELYQITKNKIYKQTVEEVISYILREMTSQSGGFFSAEDADSEGEEGKFYVWSKSEITEILGENVGEKFCISYNIVNRGNFLDEETGKLVGTNIPHLNDFTNNFSTELQKLFIERKKRIHPYKDDKILTDWNALLIAAFSKAGFVFNNDDYILAAEKAMNFLLSELIDNDGNLLHRHRNGESGILGKIDDHAFLIWANLELFQSTLQIKYLTKAIEFTEITIEEFWDKENNNGFYFTSSKDEKLISRSKEFYDGAIPSGNSVMFNNLLRLNKITNNSKFVEISIHLNKAINLRAENAASAFSHSLNGFYYESESSNEIIIVSNSESENQQEFIEELRSEFLPNSLILIVDEKNKTELAKFASFIKDYDLIDGKTTAYVCKNYTCDLPITENSDLKEKIKSI